MKELTQYQSDDGAIFSTPCAAQNRDVLTRMIREAVAHLPALPDDIDFQNGKGFLQWTQGQYDLAISGLLAAAKFEGTCKYSVEDIWAGNVSKSYVARCLDDSRSPIYKHWLRLHCLDTSLREWGQPYYATHPQEGNQVKLN